MKSGRIVTSIDDHFQGRDNARPSLAAVGRPIIEGFFHVPDSIRSSSREIASSTADQHAGTRRHSEGCRTIQHGILTKKGCFIRRTIDWQQMAMLNLLPSGACA